MTLAKISIAKADSNKKQIIISSKAFTENIVLSEMLALLLEEKYNFKVVRKFNMGGTKLIFDSLINGYVDVYPEYTGTGYAMILKQSGEKDPKKTYKIIKKEFLKRFDLIWSLPLGFENNYALLVKEKDIRFKKINLISQLQNQAHSLRLAMDYEFAERKDGFESFSKNYKFSWSKNNLFAMNQGLMHSALNNKKVDMIMAYSTDARIKAFNLKTLKDDKKFFPAYEAAYLTRVDVLKHFPKLKKAFYDLEGHISEKEMIFLNYQVDQLKYEVPMVVKNFLIQKKLLTGKVQDLKKQNLMAYYFSKKDYLLKIFIEHLILTFVSLFFALLVAIPIGIWATRNRQVEKIVFTLVNALQTIPSLALLGFLIPFLGIGFVPAVATLFVYSLLPLIRNTFEGIKNVDRNFVEASAGMGLSLWQILRFIQIPLALPMIMAGVRTSTVIVVGTATLAAFIGAGGLGDPIFRGIATLDSRLIFLGAVPACLLAIFLDKSLGFLETLVISKGLKLETNIKNIEFK